MEITLADENGEPAASEKYVLHLPDGTKRDGKLDSDGYAREDDIPPGEVEVEFPDVEYASTEESDHES